MKKYTMKFEQGEYAVGFGKPNKVVWEWRIYKPNGKFSAILKEGTTEAQAQEYIDKCNSAMEQCEQCQHEEDIRCWRHGG